MAAITVSRDHDGRITGIHITDLTADELADLTRNVTPKSRTTTPAKARLGVIQRYAMGSP